LQSSKDLIALAQRVVHVFVTKDDTLREDWGTEGMSFIILLVFLLFLSFYFGCNSYFYCYFNSILFGLSANFHYFALNST